VKLFGHHLTRSFVFFAALDAAVMAGLILYFGSTTPCHNCETYSGLRSPYGALALAALFVVATASVGLYNRDTTRDIRTFATRFLVSSPLVALPALGGFALSYLGTEAISQAQIGALALVIVGLLVLPFLLRVAFLWGLDLSFLRKRLLVFGDGETAAAVSSFANGAGRMHFRHLRTVSPHPASAEPSTMGNLSLKELRIQAPALSVLAESLGAEEIVVALDDQRDLPVDEILECKLHGIPVVDAQTFWERETGQIDPVHVGADWLAFSSGFVLDQRRRVVKRLLDVGVSLAFIVFMLPLSVLVALAIKIDSPGPLFYRQERVGLNGQVFALWKFRSMRVDAERDGVPRWANSVDDRVTRVGSFIRKVRLDEVPQIINVLAGDMSFIGPRPERPFFVEQLTRQVPHYELRHLVRPGITGWAQVNYPYGASIDDARKKLAYDLYYLKNNNFALDLAILLQTVRVVLFAEGAR
jgi:sugar transferase (PEP-CTERM system associated)